VWWNRNAHYTCGFGFGCFFGLGCFSVVFCVWDDGLVHTAMLDAMLVIVGVVGRMLKFFVAHTFWVMSAVLCTAGFLVKNLL
jgi:hypothetical protein